MQQCGNRHVLGAIVLEHCRGDRKQVCDVGNKGRFADLATMNVSGAQQGSIKTISQYGCICHVGLQQMGHLNRNNRLEVRQHGAMVCKFKPSPGNGEFIDTKVDSGNDREQRDGARAMFFLQCEYLALANNASASNGTSSGQYRAGRGWWAPVSERGRQASTAMLQRAGMAVRPCAAPSSAPQIAPLVSVSPPSPTVSTSASSIGVPLARWRNAL